MNLIRIILIVVLVYYLVRLLDKFVIPYLFGRKDKDEDVKMSGSGKKKTFSKKDGEYIDFEEFEKN